MKQKIQRHSEYFYDMFESPLGTLYLFFTGEILKGVSFKKPHGPCRKSKAPPWIKKELTEYFEIGLDKFSQKIGFLKGTEFEKMVWRILHEIPYGETRTYKWLAEKIGNPHATRAVGRALSRNPLPIVLPCHRIIESDGSIGGYSSGVNIKRRLLEIEYYINLSKKVKH